MSILGPFASANLNEDLELISISDAFVVAYCDKCNYESDPIELTALARSGSYDMRNVEGVLERWGWREEENGSHTCDECIYAEEEGEDN